MTEENKGLRFNEGKPRWGLVYYKGLEPMVRCFEYGATKYGSGNWQKGLDKREILESMQRHLASLMDGETIDEESGLPHIGFIQANANMYNYMIDKERERAEML